MGSWRKKRAENHHQEFQGRRWQSKKPPLGTWQPTVPSWEKKFCASVGSVSWEKLLEAQKFTYIYKNVINWDDSAVEEAFRSAKSRFWAKINGFPCDIPPPDPDIYIDEIDWDSIIDPELILDLEQEHKVCDNGERVIILSDSFLQDHYFCVPGFGWEPEENIPEPTNSESAPRFANNNQNLDVNNDLSENINNDGKKENMDGGTGWGLDSSGSLEQKRLENDGNLLNKKYNESEKVDREEWGCVWNDLSGQNQLESNDDVWNKNYNEPTNVGCGTGRDRGMWNRAGKKREGTGWNMSAFKTSQFLGNAYSTDCGWRNERWQRKPNFAYEQPHRNQIPNSNQRTGMNDYGPVNQSHRWGKHESHAVSRNKF